MSEAELIRRGVQRLREVAAEATPGPWNLDGATMDPLVAVALADLLDDTLLYVGRPPEWHPIARTALAVARAVLGEPEEVSGG